jgi:hypothetical protein
MAERSVSLDLTSGGLGLERRVSAGNCSAATNALLHEDRPGSN